MTTHAVRATALATLELGAALPLGHARPVGTRLLAGAALSGRHADRSPARALPWAALILGYARPVGAWPAVRAARGAFILPVYAEDLLRRVAQRIGVVVAAGLAVDAAAGTLLLVGAAVVRTEARESRRAFGVGALLLAGAALVRSDARTVVGALIDTW